MIAYIIAIGLVILGTFTLLFKDNLIKKIIGLVVLSNGIHLFVISLGYRAGGIPPILESIDVNRISAMGVDPLMQALILTSIVISLSIISVALALVIQVFRKTGSIKSKDLGGLKE